MTTVVVCLPPFPLLVRGACEQQKDTTTRTENHHRSRIVGVLVLRDDGNNNSTGEEGSLCTAIVKLCNRPRAVIKIDEELSHLNFCMDDFFDGHEDDDGFGILHGGLTHNWF